MLPSDGGSRRDGTQNKIVDFVGAGLADGGLSPLQSIAVTSIAVTSLLQPGQGDDRLLYPAMPGNPHALGRFVEHHPRHLVSAP